MPSRRPPSQRDPAYATHRLAGTLAQAAPGLKVKNAAPVKARTPNRIAQLLPAAFVETWARNRFALTASGAQTLLLSHEPKATPLFVFLNGMYQDEGTDYLLDSVGLQVQTAMGAASGDVVDVRYIVAGPAAWLDDMGAAIMADAPDLYWPLTDAVGATSALDISGNGRDGYLWIDGSITFGQPGLVSGSSATAADINWARIKRDHETWMDSTAFTLEVLLRSTDTGGAGLWFRDDRGIGEDTFRFLTDAGTGKLVFQQAIVGWPYTTQVIGTADVVDGTVHHVIARYDGTTLDLFVDGVLDGSGAMTLNSSAAPLLLAGLYTSGYGTDSNSDFIGRMQHAAVYTHALSDARIAAHAAAAGL